MQVNLTIATEQSVAPHQGDAETCCYWGEVSAGTLKDNKTEILTRFIKSFLSQTCLSMIVERAKVNVNRPLILVTNDKAHKQTDNRLVY